MRACVCVWLGARVRVLMFQLPKAVCETVYVCEEDRCIMVPDSQLHHTSMSEVRFEACEKLLKC